MRAMLRIVRRFYRLVGNQPGIPLAVYRRLDGTVAFITERNTSLLVLWSFW